MKLRHVTILGLAALLAACGQKTQTNESSPSASTADSGAATAKGSGMVTAIDKSAGTITLDHAPVPEANLAGDDHGVQGKARTAW